MYKRWWFIFNVVISFLLIAAASAHPADMFFQTHTVEISTTGINVTLEMIPGPLLASNIWQEADLDGNELIDFQESRNWANTILKYFVITLDQQPQPIEIDSVIWPESVEALYSADEPITIQFSATWTEKLSATHIVTVNNFYQNNLSVYWFKIKSSTTIGFDTPRQQNGLLTVPVSKLDIDPMSELLNAWESGKPTIPWVIQSLGLDEVAEQAASETNSGSGSRAILEGLIKNDTLTPVFVFSALALSFLLGMLHALTPGHGKTIVAAYLVGTNGKWFHALLLGGIVTITHTGSVLLIGVLTLYLSNSLFTPDLIAKLEIFSGILIVLLSAFLIYQRYPALKKNLQYRKKTSIRFIDTTFPVNNEKQTIKLNIPIEEISQDHTHTPNQPGYIPRGNNSKKQAPAIEWQSMIALGVSGGLIPCPDAIAILLIAITIQRIAFGISMILTFSMGLAIVLITIGIIIVQGKNIFRKLKFFDQVGIWVPMSSALIVLLVGIGLIQGAIKNNIPLNSSSPQTTQQLVTVDNPPQFNIRNSSILFTAMDVTYQYQLFKYDISNANTLQLANNDGGIWDFSLSPDNQHIIYSIPDEYNGSLFVEIDLESNNEKEILNCSNAYCANIEWHPDGQYFLYSRLDNATYNSLGISSIWWFDINTLETNPLFQSEDMPAYNQNFSTDGKWISYATINPQQIRLYEVESGDSIIIPSETGSEILWPPAGENVYIIDTSEFEGYYIPKIYQYNLSTQEKILLLNDFRYDESLGSLSPSGEWIAVNRRDWSATSNYSGNQIWLISVDGKNQRIISDRKEAYYSQTNWSPDGRYLLYYISPLGDNKDDVGIYYFDIETNEEHQLTNSGNRPIWLPEITH
jgi:nickel/cobalt transporter (NicO) family protein